jgi:hypothetical protein
LLLFEVLKMIAFMSKKTDPSGSSGSYRIPPDIRDVFAAKAAADGVKLSALVTDVLKTYLKECGYWPPSSAITQTEEALERLRKRFEDS